MVQVVDAEETATELTVRFSAKDVAAIMIIIKKIGKFSGHDNLRIEHLQHVGVSHELRALRVQYNVQGAEGAGSVAIARPVCSARREYMLFMLSSGIAVPAAPRARHAPARTAS